MKEKQQLLYLINGLLDNTYDIKTFCEEFTRIYDLELDYDTLSKQEESLLGEICIMSARFSNDPEELHIPNMYYSEEQIRHVVEQTSMKLSSM